MTHELSAMIISVKYILFLFFFLGQLLTFFNKSMCYGLWFSVNLFDSSYFRKNKGSKVHFTTLQVFAFKEISI